MHKINSTARHAIAALAITTLLALPLAAENEIIKAEATVSYYGEEFNGKPTSSGEIFDMNGLTAAHKTLPFGTMLEITNLDNGKKVTVRVNDRGPFVDNRELDVSKAAAVQLGMLGNGTARASIVKVADPDNAVTAAVTPTTTAALPASNAPASAAPTATSTTAVPTSTQPAATSQPAATTVPTGTPPAVVAAPKLADTSTGAQWRIQLGSFSHEDNAFKLVARLRKDGFSPAYEKTGTLTRVVLAGIADRDLKTVRAKLDSSGYGSYVVRQEAW